jgi:hypothetical protein
MIEDEAGKSITEFSGRKNGFEIYRLNKMNQHKMKEIPVLFS